MHPFYWMFESVNHVKHISHSAQIGTKGFEPVFFIVSLSNDHLN